MANVKLIWTDSFMGIESTSSVIVSQEEYKQFVERCLSLKNEFYIYDYFYFTNGTMLLQTTSTEQTDEDLTSKDVLETLEWYNTIMNDKLYNEIQLFNRIVDDNDDYDDDYDCEEWVTDNYETDCKRLREDHNDVISFDYNDDCGLF